MFRLTWIFWVYSLVLVAPCVADQTSEIEQELRIVWGGPTARAYLGSISVSDGTVKLVRNLSMQENAVGVVLQNDLKSIQLQQQSSTNFGGCDIAVKASLSGRLRIAIQEPGSEKMFERAVNLVDIQQSNWIEVIDEAGCRIAIERQVSDRLRVDNRVQKSTIFECNSIWTPSVSGYKTGLPEGEYQLLAAWANSRNNYIANMPVTVDATGSFNPIQLEIRVPSVEGAQRLELSLARASLMSAISSVKPLLSRSVDVIAFEPTTPPQTISRWNPVLAIDTAAAVKPEGLSWLTSFTGSLANRALEVPESLRLPGLDLSEQLNRLIPFSKVVASYGTVSKSGQIGVRQYSSTGGELSERATVIGPDSWLSLPLSGLQPNKAHRLRVQIPIDQPSSLSVCVQDAGVDKDLLLEPQSSVEIKEEECSLAGGSVTHEIVFWPRSESINLLLASASRTRTAAVGKILLEIAELANSTAQSASSSGRQVALYIDQPLLVECYGAPREKDPLSGRYYETWKTWQAIAERLTLQLQISGANTLVLSGISGGNSLIPLDSIPRQHRLNKSTFFSDGRSADDHDFIELLLLHFDRAGFKLILETDFPASEQFRRSLGTEPDMEQVDLLNGTKRMIVGGEPVASTRLNPLHRKVQIALLEPLKEVVQRYHTHPSFGGLSLRLDNNSQFLFAGDRWGYNDQLIKQFAGDNGLTIPEDPQQRLQLFSGPARLRFIHWRAQLMADFFARLTQALQTIDQESQLYINLVRLSDRMPSESDFIEPEVIVRNSQQLLQCYGVDIDALSKIRGLTISQGEVQHAKRLPGTNDWLRGPSVDWPTNNQQMASQATLVTHQPRALKLASDLEKQRGPGTETWIYPDATRQGAQARRILVEQLGKSDPTLLGFGGWRPVWVGDADVGSLLATYKTLPAIGLDELNVLPVDSPLRLRSGVDQGRGYLSLVNLSPWEITLQLQTSVKPDSVELAAPSAGSIDKTRGGITVRVPAFDLMVLSTDNPRELEVESANYTLPEQSVESTTQRLQKLEALLAQAADPGQQEVLFGIGGTFEQWSSINKPAGWNVSTLPMTTIQRASELPRSGSYSILMENRGAEPLTAWIQSAPISLPETGRLTLRAWLRASAADQAPPKVRLGLIGRTSTGERYQRSITYGGNQKDGSRFLSNDWGRRPAELHVADVPVEDLAELHVAIDLIGEGRIWVDDVEVVQSWLHPDERNYLRGQVLVVKQKLANNSPFAAERLLRTPWSEYLFELDSQQNPAASGPLMSPLTEEIRSDWNRTKPTLQQLRESMRNRWNR